MQELTKKEEGKVELWNKATKWASLPVLLQVSVILAACGMLVSNSAFVLLGEMCFRPFSLSSKINDPYEAHGLNKNALNIVLQPMGSCVLALFGAAVLLHAVSFAELARRAKAAA